MAYSHKSVTVDANGSIVPGAAVEVRDRAGVLATIYNATGGALTNPFTSDAAAEFEFYAIAGTYFVTTGTSPSDFKETVVLGPDGDFSSVSIMISNTSMRYTPSADYQTPVIAGEVLSAAGYRYAVAASAATDHHLTTSGGVKLYVLTGSDSTVRPEQFGAVGDGSDETDIMEAIRDFGVSNGSLHLVLTAGKTYSYTNPYWLNGIPNSLVIDANGASFQCINATVNGASPTNSNNEGLVFPTVFYNGGNQTGGGNDQGPLCDTVLSGATTVTLSSETATDFVVGQRFLIYGYATQSIGFPNTCKYFEYGVVAGVSGSTITLERPLQYSYYDDWPLNEVNPQWGPARIISCSRSDFQETARIEFNDLRMKPDPAWLEVDGGTKARNGRIWFGCCRLGTLNSVRSPAGLYIMQQTHFVDNGSVFEGSTEIDKMITSATFNGVTYNELSQGTGCMDVTVNNSTLNNVLSLEAINSVTVNGGVLVCEEGNTSVFSNTYGSRSITLNSPVIIPASTTTKFINDNERDCAFTKLSETQISCTLSEFRSSNMIRALRNGTTLFDADGVRVLRVVSVPRLSGTDMLMDVEFLTHDSGAWPRDLYSEGTESLVVKSPYFDGENPTKIWKSGAGASSRFYSDQNSEAFVAFTSAEHSALETAIEGPLVGGAMIVTRLEFTLSKEYTGPTTSLNMFIEDQDFTDLASIRINTAGTRIVDLTGTAGTQTGDTLGPLPTSPMNRITVRTSKAVDTSDQLYLPEWSLRVYGIRV